MYKNIKYLFVFVILFSFFKVNVNAAVYASGDCIYNFSGSKFGGDGNFSFRINQNSDGKVSYYYSYDKLSSATVSGWEAEDESALGGFHVRYSEKASFLDESIKASYLDKITYTAKYKSCPKFALLKDNGIDFSKFIDENIFKAIGENIVKVGSELSKDEVGGHEIFFVDEITDKLKNEYGVYTSVNSSPSINYNYSSGEGGKCSSEINWLKEPNDTSNNGGSCLYAGDSSDGCYVVQINYKLDELNGNSFEKISNFENWDSFKSYTSYYEEGFQKMFYETGCQGVIGVGQGLRSHDAIGHPQPVNSIMYSYSLHSGIKDSNNNFYNNFVHLNEVKSTDINVSIINSGTIVKYENCEEILGDDLVSMLKSVLGISRITVPILLNVFGVIDFGSAIFASDEEKMKKAQKKFINRLIIGIVIFMIPSVLKLILSIAHNIWPVVDGSLCGIL